MLIGRGRRVLDGAGDRQPVARRSSSRCSPAALLSLLHGVVTIHLRADQVVSGLALTFLGTGLARVLGEGLTNDRRVARLPRLTSRSCPRSRSSGRSCSATRASSSTSASCSCPLAWFWIERTRPGLHLRAVGENPARPTPRGSTCTGSRYAYVVVGGVLAGLAGATITLAVSPGWFGDQTVNGRGWIAIGLVIFAQWSPLRAAFGALPVRGDLAVHPRRPGRRHDPRRHEPVPGRPLRDVLPRDAAVPVRDRGRGHRLARGAPQARSARRPRSGSRTSAGSAAPEAARRLFVAGYSSSRRRGPAAPSGRSRSCRTRAGAARTASRRRPGRPARTRRPPVRRPGPACRRAAGRAASRTRGARTSRR